jgi:hypothetical protein
MIDEGLKGEGLTPEHRARLDRMHERLRTLAHDPLWRATWRARQQAGTTAFYRDPDNVAAVVAKRRATLAARPARPRTPAQRASFERAQTHRRALDRDPTWRATMRAKVQAAVTAFRRDPAKVAAAMARCRATLAARPARPLTPAQRAHLDQLHARKRSWSPTITTLEAWLHQHIEPEPNSGCWVWVGTPGGNGYGQVSVPVQFGPRRHGTAHRVVYEATGHLLPRDADLHHVCRVRICVNPAHLEALTRSEHGRRTIRDGRRHRVRGDAVPSWLK